MDFLQARFNGREITHIGAKSSGFGAKRLERGHRVLHLVRGAAGHGDPGTVLRKQFGDAAVDAAGSADYYHRPAGEIDCQTHEFRPFAADIEQAC